MRLNPDWLDGCMGVASIPQLPFDQYRMDSDSYEIFWPHCCSMRGSSDVLWVFIFSP